MEMNTYNNKFHLQIMNQEAPQHTMNGMELRSKTKTEPKQSVCRMCMSRQFESTEWTGTMIFQPFK